MLMSQLWLVHHLKHVSLIVSNCAKEKGFRINFFIILLLFLYSHVSNNN